MVFFREKGEKGVKRSLVPVPTAPLVVPCSCEGGGQHETERGGGGKPWKTLASTARISHLNEMLAKGHEKLRWIFPS